MTLIDTQFTEQDKATLATLYKNSIPNAKFLRKALLKAELTGDEKEQLEALKSSPAIIEVLEKLFNPKVTFDGVITHNYNLFTSFELVGVDLGYVDTMSRVRQRMTDFLQAGFKILEGKEATSGFFTESYPNLEFTTRTESSEENAIAWHTYNEMLKHIDNNIVRVLQLANLDTEEDKTAKQENISKANNRSK